MSEEPVISVRDVSKAYRIWSTPSSRLISPLQNGLAGVLPAGAAPARWLRDRATRSYRDFWALKDMSFDVRKGESFGIIGRNGSGKSTLLQIITGTLQATTGSVGVQGRVAALLELGSGFNGDFTGRENVYLSGSVLGLSRQEIDAKFDQIAAFADIGDFIEEPAKTYSSGMLVRLAFAVQTAVNPDILIIDEALSVGDEAFQRKCFARIEALKKQGTTLLFVSHSANQVIEICDRALLLSAGQCVAIGRPKEVVNIYHQMVYGGAATPAEAPPAPPAPPAATPAATPAGDWVVSVENPPPPGDDSFFGQISEQTSLHEYAEAGARIREPYICNQAGKPVNHLRRGQEYFYIFDTRFTSTLSGVRWGGMIKTLSGVEIAGMLSHRGDERIPRVNPGDHYRVRFKFRCDLLAGAYFMNAGALAVDARGTEYFAHRLVDACMFRVIYEPNLPVNALANVLERAEICRLAGGQPDA
jgi:lipopolysaccharide transport system ATP-binding protein